MRNFSTNIYAEQRLYWHKLGNYNIMILYDLRIYIIENVTLYELSKSYLVQHKFTATINQKTTSCRFKKKIII